jgi:DNA repair protein RadA/Sms
MKSPTSLFECSKCGAQTPKWSGRCLSCGAWGTVKEGVKEEVTRTVSAKGGSAFGRNGTVTFNEKKLIDFQNVDHQKFTRLSTGIGELDNLFGGGIVKGSLILIGGEPGIGKSTIVLQIFKNLEGANAPLLYVSGEESAEQVKLRAERLNYQPKILKFLSETNVEQIAAAIATIKPTLAIIDSIQTIYSGDVTGEAGAVSQIRACTVKLLQVAKENNIPILITGHVTKDGAVAGPKTLEHLVDVVAYLEGDKYHGFRVLRTVKNRFGSTNEIAIFEMTGAGLIEVKNPSEAFLQTGTENIAGSAISCFCEGTRAFLVEIQALVSPVLFGYPQRKTSGFDSNRLQMLSAVIAKRANLNLNTQDIHLNVVGGFKIKEPALDLAVAAAIISAMKNKPIDRQTVILGEIGLGGEIRHVQNLERRLSEAEKLNFTTAIIPVAKLSKNFRIKIIPIKTLADLTDKL